jgi:hypothetical protein
LKCLQGTNTLAFYKNSEIASGKSFKQLAPGGKDKILSDFKIKGTHSNRFA